MSIVATSDITNESVIERFQSAVVENILNGVYHAGNPPMCRGFQCVPIAYMDHVSNVNKTPNVGNDGTIISATQLLNGLIDITRNLTRVGSFVFTLWKKNTQGGVDSNGNEVASSSWKTEEASASGKVLFTNAYIRSGFTLPSSLQQGTVAGNTMTAANINQLFANIYSAWSSADRYEHTESAEICHSSCHDNCHSNCHGACHCTCHGWSGRICAAHNMRMDYDGGANHTDLWAEAQTNFTITTTSINAMKVGDVFSQTLRASASGISWTVKSGSLPDGISLSRAGILSGMPTKSGTYTFTIECSTSGASQTKAYTATVTA